MIVTQVGWQTCRPDLFLPNCSQSGGAAQLLGAFKAMFVIREEHRREYQRRAKDPPLDWAILKGCNLLNVGSIEFWKHCKTLLIFFAMIFIILKSSPQSSFLIWQCKFHHFHCLSHHNHQLVKMIIIPEIIFTRWWSFRWTRCRDDHHHVKMIFRMMMNLTRWQSFQWRSSRQADDHLCTAVTVNRLLSMQFSSPPNLQPPLIWATPPLPLSSNLLRYSYIWAI